MTIESNPKQCEHSMVTDLCGLCIRDKRIVELEQQIKDILSAIKDHKYIVSSGTVQERYYFSKNIERQSPRQVQNDK